MMILTYLLHIHIICKMKVIERARLGRIAGGFALGVLTTICLDFCSNPSTDDKPARDSVPHDTEHKEEEPHIVLARELSDRLGKTVVALPYGDQDDADRFCLELGGYVDHTYYPGQTWCSSSEDWNEIGSNQTLVPAIKDSDPYMSDEDSFAHLVGVCNYFRENDGRIVTLGVVDETRVYGCELAR